MKILGRGFKVERVTEGNTSTVHPPFDPEWSLLTKLQWHAAVATLDSGTDIEIRVTAGYSAYKPKWSPFWITRDDVFAISLPGKGWSPMDFDSAWTFINGIGAGLSAGRTDR